MENADTKTNESSNHGTDEHYFDICFAWIMTSIFLNKINLEFFEYQLNVWFILYYLMYADV